MKKTLFTLFTMSMIAAGPLVEIKETKNIKPHKALTTPPPLNEPVEEKGMSFDDETLYQLDSPITEKILTWEATIKLPTDIPDSDRGGIILGSFGYDYPAISFEIYKNGQPRFYQGYKDHTSGEYAFSTIDLRTNEWVHLAIVNDYSNGKMNCYINGVQVVSAKKSIKPGISNQPLLLGADMRSGNQYYFKGRIENIALYSTARNEEQVLSDYESVNLSNEGLVAYYDLNDKQGTSDINNLASNKYNFHYENPWIDPSEKRPLMDYSYSFAVIGDIQTLLYYYPDQLPKVFDYVANNIESKNIKFAFSMGDSTEKDTNAEWDLARQQYAKFDGKLPYSIIRGNHDSSIGMNRVFNDNIYSKSYDGSYDGYVDNTYTFLDVGNTKYIVFALDYGPSDDVLTWAGEILEANPDRQAIITTHGYLYRDGTTIDELDECPPARSGGYNDGIDVWEKFASQYANVRLVLSGHDPSDDVVVSQDTGIMGNKVTQVLVDPQGNDLLSPKGLVCMLYFNEAGDKMEVEYYSTVREKFFKASNQKIIDLGPMQQGTSTLEYILITLGIVAGAAILAGGIVLTIVLIKKKKAKKLKTN